MCSVGAGPFYGSAPFTLFGCVTAATYGANTDMKHQIKVMVAHPEQQHSYRLAAALDRAGMLDCYVTTVYYGPRSLTKLVASILPHRWGEKARSRRCAELSDAKVIQLCEGEGLLKLLCQNVPIMRRWYYKAKLHVADRFSVKVARLALKRGVDAVIVFDGTSPILFEALRRDAPEVIRILDMSAANTLYMRQIYEHDLELQPDYADMLKGERQIVWNPERAERSEREIKAAQHFLCGSEFVIRSLAYSGVDADCCDVCPYGVDSEQFVYMPHEAPRKDQPIRCIFVGGTKELKGISYLLEAFERLDPNLARLTVVGSCTLSEELRLKHGGHVVFVGTVPHDQVPMLMSEHDLMIMPSLGEGFSLTILEAMACGLPVICTQNSGAVGIVSDGVDGRIVPIQDADAIARSVLWFVEHRDMISRMGAKARATAEHYSWAHYGQCVTEAIRSIVSGSVN